MKICECLENMRKNRRNLGKFIKILKVPKNFKKSSEISNENTTSDFPHLPKNFDSQQNYSNVWQSL